MITLKYRNKIHKFNIMIRPNLVNENLLKMDQPTKIPNLNLNFDLKKNTTILANLFGLLFIFIILFIFYITTGPVNTNTNTLQMEIPTNNQYLQNLHIFPYDYFN